MPSKLSFSSLSPWNALPREVRMGLGCTQVNDREPTESSGNGHAQPKIHTIRDHTLKLLMLSSVLELQAVRVVHTPHRDEWRLNLKVLVRFTKKVVIANVLLDSGAQMSLVQKGLFSDEFLKPRNTGALEGRQWQNYGWGYP